MFLLSSIINLHLSAIMVSEISDGVLQAAHELNVRDARIVESKENGSYEQQKENFSRR